MNNSFATGKLRGPFKHVLPFSRRLTIAISGGRGWRVASRADPLNTWLDHRTCRARMAEPFHWV